MKILVTGCAGFIGYHLCQSLLINKNYKIKGIDNLNNYYDVSIKKERLKDLKRYKKKFSFSKIDISNYNKLAIIFQINKFDIVINLAAQAGVRFSIESPKSYLHSNIIGFFNILELSKLNKIKHLIYASTSSVYGTNKKFPLKENYQTDTPISFYAATKKSNEVMAHSYSAIYSLPTTGLRFFTVYGPNGRPDMALYKFVNLITKNQKVELYNYGNHSRDFTYIDDVVNCIVKLITKIPNKKIPYEIYNIGSNNPISLNFFLSIIEKNLKRKAKLIKLPMQKGDIKSTYSDINKLHKKIKYAPTTKISDGIKNFINWFIYKKNKS